MKDIIRICVEQPERCTDARLARDIKKVESRLGRLEGITEEFRDAINDGDNVERVKRDRRSRRRKRSLPVMFLLRRRMNREKKTTLRIPQNSSF